MATVLEVALAVTIAEVDIDAEGEFGEMAGIAAFQLFAVVGTGTCGVEATNHEGSAAAYFIMPFQTDTPGRVNLGAGVDGIDFLPLFQFLAVAETKHAADTAESPELMFLLGIVTAEEAVDVEHGVGIAGYHAEGVGLGLGEIPCHGAVAGGPLGVITQHDSGGEPLVEMLAKLKIGVGANHREERLLAHKFRHGIADAAADAPEQVVVKLIDLGYRSVQLQRVLMRLCQRKVGNKTQCGQKEDGSF